MRADGVGNPKKARRLQCKAVWLGLLAGLFSVAIPASLGGRESLAQSTLAPEPNQAQTTGQASTPAATSPQTPAAGEQTPPESHQSSPGSNKNPIAEQSANLLKLANSLKAEVDKTTVDTLSVQVIRNAEAIEKLAHKMRSR